MENKKKNILPIIIGIALVVIVIILILVFRGKSDKKLDKIDKTKSISKVTEVLPVNYKSIDCSDDCKYFYAYNGSDSLTGKYDFYTETGKKIGEYDISKVDKKIAVTLDIEDVSKNYFIMSYMDTDKLDSKYVVYSMKGKVIVEADDASVLTDNYFTATKGDVESIFDNSGKAIYEDVSSVDSYNNKYITFELNDVDKIIDEKGKEILSGYTISKVVLDDSDEIDYLIIKNTEDGVYNYYNIKENSKKGDSFTGYSTVDDKIIITKKVDSKSKKFVLNSNGEQTEYVEEVKNTSSSQSYYDTVKKNVNEDKYGIFASVINKEDQNYILVNLKEENKFGVLDISKDEFKELGTYKENSNRRLTLKRISKDSDNSTSDDVIYSIECSTYYCDNDIQFIYNFTENKLLASRDGSKESLIYSFQLYEDGNYIIENTSSKFNDSDKYILYDKSGKELLNSDNYIKVIDGKIMYYSSSIYDTGKINLYSLKDKKVINLDSDNEIMSVSSKQFKDDKLYQFSDKKNTYLLSENGEIVKLDGTLKSNDDIGVYLSDDKKISYYNVFTKDLTEYELKQNESINDTKGYELIPYRNAIFVNNSYDYTTKIIGNNGKSLFEKKNLQIYDITKKSDGSIIITVIDKNDKKGLYIAR